MEMDMVTTVILRLVCCFIRFLLGVAQPWINSGRWINAQNAITTPIKNVSGG